MFLDKRVVSTSDWVYRSLIRLCLIVIFSAGSSPGDPVFTGDASADFNLTGSLVFEDPGGMDVGRPSQLMADAAPGWDVRSLHLYYNRTSDMLFAGADFYSIAGDADGDGDPDGTGPSLEALGGVDRPELSGTESIVLLIDCDLDGEYEIAIGVNGTADIRDFGAYRFTGRKHAPSLGFGERLAPDPVRLYSSPDRMRPDIEFTISDFSSLLSNSSIQNDSLSNSTQGLGFRTTLFAGSLEDCGIGDDLVPGPDGTQITLYPEAGGDWR